MEQQQTNLTNNTDHDVQGFGSAGGAIPDINRRQFLGLTLLGAQALVVAPQGSKPSISVGSN